MILCLDRELWTAAPWALAGVVIAFFAPKALDPLAPLIEQWPRWLNPHAEQSELQLLELVWEGKTESEEFKRLMDEESFWITFAIPPISALSHGPLLGAPLGALWALGGDSPMPAAATAAIGLLIGPVLVAFMASFTLACIVHPIPGDSAPTRLARRIMLAAAPLLLIPFAWHCVQAVAKRRKVT